MNQQPQPFLPILVPQQHQAQYLRESVPCRVQVAMDYLRYLAFKESPMAAVNGISIEWRDGQVPVPPEDDARNEACKLLVEYFSGKLEAAAWEKKVDRRLDEKRRKGVPSVCFNCAGKNPGCLYCSGEGSIVIYPASKGAFE